MADQETRGASNNERLIAAVRADNDQLVAEILEEGDIDINCGDGLGNTPLHNAVIYGAFDSLEHILSHEDCDVDPINRIEKATPLHYVRTIEDPDLRAHIFESLLDAGADYTIRDKNGDTAIDLLPPDDTTLQAILRKYQAQASVSKEDVASEGEDEGDYSSSGSESDDEEEAK